MGTDARITPRLVRGLGGLLASAVVVALTALFASGATAQTAGTDGLEEAVVDEMLQEGTSDRGFSAVQREERTQTNVERTSGDEWAFGTAVILAPKKRGAYPEGWLFVAEKTGAGWNVGLEGSDTFSALAEKAATRVVSEDEKELFASGSDREFQAVKTGLRLPWQRGGRWKLTGGPHGWATGYDRPYSALDFTGRSGQDQSVRAAAGGRVYRMCRSNRGWLRVVHANGYATDYYHLRGNIKRKQGARIGRGAFLGYTGEDVSCGGAAYGRHVHFAIRRGGNPVAIDDRTLGGWTFQQGKSYQGHTRRGKIIRTPVTVLRNFGP